MQSKTFLNITEYKFNRCGTLLVSEPLKHVYAANFLPLIALN